ncbi:hypothetical protein AB0H28_06180 [Micromonospora sp. NPDC050980]|uniref:hypothetical protein n=1 Tax=Micromonospora sp. NPDC050980 TaxID=3155161 RepID=UPI0033C799A6
MSRRFLPAPVVVALALALVVEGVPLQARWAVSRGAFEKVVATLPTTSPADVEWSSVPVPRRIGAYRITAAGLVQPVATQAIGRRLDLIAALLARPATYRHGWPRPVRRGVGLAAYGRTMVTVADVRALARTLPRSSEHLIRDRVKFRVGASSSPAPPTSASTGCAATSPGSTAGT